MRRNYIVGGFVDTCQGYPSHQREYMRNYHRNNMLTINGKRIKVNKRPRPDDICEVCGRIVARLDYHHWDDSHPEQGVWVCKQCHLMAEGIDHDRHYKYLQLRESVAIPPNIPS